MKKILVLALFFLAGYGLAQSQGREKLREEIKKQQIEFVSSKLALSADEESKFTPLYSKYLDEFEELRIKQKTEKLEKVDLTFMSDAECEKLMQEMIQYREAEIALIKKYNEEFKKILPVKKVAMIYKAEHEFKKQVIKKFKSKRSK